MNIDKIPQLIRLSDYRLANLSLRALANAFKIAQQYFSDEDFEKWQQEVWSGIERARLHPSAATMQNVVDHLEGYKRRLGRQFAATHDVYVALKYNEIERDIRWLTAQYECIRSSKPYYITIK